MVSVSPPWAISVSATYCVMRYPRSLSRESITASDGGKLRVGAVGRPSRRAVAVSRRPWAAESAAVRAVVSGRGGGEGGRLGVWASSVPAAASSRATSPAPVAGEELRRHEAQGREDHHHEGQLHGEPDGDQELRRKRKISVGGNDRGEHMRLEAEQHQQEARQQ